MKMNMTVKPLLTTALCAVLCTHCSSWSRAAVIRGTEDNPDVLMRWHRVSLSFDGPATRETADPNPCFNYRLDVTLRAPSGQVMTVPGFFAADGQAGRSGADSGKTWRAYVCPDQVGTWKASYDQGKGRGFQLDLSGVKGRFKVQWLNPREGGAWQSGSIERIKAGGTVDLGEAPDTLDQDWCCIVRKL
jgi:hypothetical protein